MEISARGMKVTIVKSILGARLAVAHDRISE